MSENNDPTKSNPDDLTTPTEPETIELTEKDMERVAGGAYDTYLKIK